MFIRIFFSSKGRQRFDGIRAVFGNREEQINIRILGDCFVKKPGKESLSAKFRVGEGAAFRQGFFVGNKRQTGCQTAIREITQEVGEMFFFHRIGQLDAVMAVAKCGQISNFLQLLLGEQIGWANMNIQVHGGLLMKNFL